MAFKKQKLKILPGDNPIEILDDNEGNIPDPSEEQKANIYLISSTIKAYLGAVKKLLEQKYSYIKEGIPTHLKNPGTIYAFYCSDGIVIRYECKNETKRIGVAYSSESIVQIVSKFSENLIHCHQNNDFIPETGMEITISKTDASGRVMQDVMSFNIAFNVVIQKPEIMPKAPSKPFCLLSVGNSFEFQFRGVITNDDTKLQDGQQFITRSKVRLPVGWECIEVYPFFYPEQWKAEYAEIWAERDILAAVVAHNANEAQFQFLDPNVSARREFAVLLKSYEDLLDSNPEREEILQTFLRDHPLLLSPAHIKMWPKLRFGSHITDFVFREAAGDYLLVELEPSTHRLFIQDGHTSKELNHAKGQITDWKRYLEDNLRTVQHELGLTDISTNPKSLVVIGRSASLTPDNRRKLIALENETPKVKIMTYDDVYDNAKAVIENLLGPIWDVGGNTEIYYPKK